MRKIIFLSLAAIPAFACAQTGTYIIKGKVGHYNAPSKVFMLKSPNRPDTAYVHNGEFTFTGHITEPRSVILMMADSNQRMTLMMMAAQQGIYKVDSKSFYLESGTITLTSKDSLFNAVVKGGPVNTDSEKFAAISKATNEAMAAALKEYAAVPAEKKQAPEYAGLRSRIESLQKENVALMSKFIAQNPKSYISLTLLVSMALIGKDIPATEALFNQLDAGLRESETGVSVAKAIKRGNPLAIGALAPDFTQNDVNGRPVKLSDFRGKYVLIDFWASWCGPCRRENPNVVNAFNTYKDRDFTVLGVSLDNPGGKDKWLAAIKEDGLTWTQVSDLKGWGNDAAKLYGVGAVPQNYLIDPDGKIVASNLRGDDLKAKLAELIK